MHYNSFDTIIYLYNRKITLPYMCHCSILKINQKINNFFSKSQNFVIFRIFMRCRYRKSINLKIKIKK